VGTPCAQCDLTLCEGKQTKCRDLFAQYIQQTSQSRLQALAYLLATSPYVRGVLRQQMADGEATINSLVTQLDAADLDRRDTATLAAMTDAWGAYS